MGPRIYTPREASVLVPKLSRAFDDVDEIRQRLKTIKGKIDVLEMIWGEEVQAETNPDHKEHKHYLEKIEQAKKDYDSAGRPTADFKPDTTTLKHHPSNSYSLSHDLPPS